MLSFYHLNGGAGVENLIIKYCEGNYWHGRSQELLSHDRNSKPKQNDLTLKCNIICMYNSTILNIIRTLRLLEKYFTTWMKWMHWKWPATSEDRKYLKGKNISILCCFLWSHNNNKRAQAWHILINVMLVQCFTMD